MQTDKSTPQRAYLYTSLGLFFLGITLYVFYVWVFGFESLADDPFSRLAEAFPLYIVMLITMIVAPIYEEVIFRIWVTKKRWAFWTTTLLIIAFGWGSEAYWVTLIGVALLTYLVFEKQFLSVHARRTAFFALSSLSFALMHLDFGDSGAFMAIQVIYYFGIGGLFAYVGLRFGFTYSVISHIAFNSILILVVLFGEKHGNIHFEPEDGTQAELTSLSMFSSRSSINNVLNEDSMYYQGTLGGILIGISNGKKQNLMIDNTNQLFRYTLSATSKNGRIDYNTLWHAYIDQLHLVLDTIEVDAYCLHFDDQYEKTDRSEAKMQEKQLKSVAHLIRMNQKIPVIVCDTSQNHDRLIEIDTDFYFLKSKSKLETYLKSKGALLSSESDTTMLKVVIRDY